LESNNNLTRYEEERKNIITLDGDTVALAIIEARYGRILPETGYMYYTTQALRGLHKCWLGYEIARIFRRLVSLFAGEQALTFTKFITQFFYPFK
jgi:hypothetical protein